MTLLADSMLPVGEHLFATEEDLQAGLYQHIANLANKAIYERGRFSIVLTGGRTVLPLYRRLRDLNTPWMAWRVFWGDERCLPKDHCDRNSRQAFDVWLEHVPIPLGNVFPIPAEAGPHVAADLYGKQLAGEGKFDLVLLSLGEDGHIASIFPGAQLQNSAVACPVTDAPKAPAQRVTLSLSRLAATRSALVLAVGSGKQAALRSCRTNQCLPLAEFSRIAPLDIWVDRAAKGCDEFGSPP